MPVFAYETPLELPDDVTLNPRVIEINGMKWQARSDCHYKFDYYAAFDRIQRANKFTAEEQKAEPLEFEENIYRNLMQDDLWFFVYFAIKNPLANHPFIVDACKEIEDERENTLELWARDHLKTTIITTGRTCQKILNNPNLKIGIFSANRPLAEAVLVSIRDLFESDFLKKSFPDILWADPYKDAPKWSKSVDGGLIVKRSGFQKEPTVGAYGLTEGMPTGFHFDDLIYDDIVTKDTLGPDIMQKVKENFWVSLNIGSRNSQYTVVGTTYRHDDPLMAIKDKRDPVTGEPLFKVRKKTGTVDGTINGRSVFMPEKAMAFRRAADLYTFKCQQLLDPSPKGTEKLNPDFLVKVSKSDLPSKLYNFMIIEPAGSTGKRKDNRSSDAWAMGVIGVEPYRDDIGLSNIYILDLVIEPMDLVQAQKCAVDMYCRNGRIRKLGVEKVGMSTTEIHIANALRAKKKNVSIENGTLEILRPGAGGLGKEFRIESKLAWPLNNGKIHIMDTITYANEERLITEMKQFPHWHDDGLDMISYIYDLIKSFRFVEFTKEEIKADRWDRMRSKWEPKKDGWLYN